MDVRPSRSRANSDSGSNASSNRSELVGRTSPGVRRMQIIAEELNNTDRVFIFISLFLVAYVYGLDGLLRSVYQPYATSGFATHSTLATINVLRSVIAAAAYPTAARIADVFGRLELVIVSVVFYILGTIIDATCHNVQGFAAGAVLYQIGYTTILLLVEVIIADITSTRTRLVLSYVPTLPFLINTWISGDVSEAVLSVATWRWGIGMWGIAFTGASIPLIVSLWLPYRRAKKAGKLAGYESPFSTLGPRRLAEALFWQLDVTGTILLIAMFSFILVPFTIAGGATIAGGTSEQWGRPKIIAPLVIGILSIPVWIIWERNWAGEHALLPFRLLQDRAVWGALGIAWMLNFCWCLQGNFLYTVLIVAFDESIKSATRITSLYTFCSVFTGAILGLVVLRVHYLKPFIIFGTILFLAAFGVLIRYRGGGDDSSHAGIVGGQIFLGIAGGLFPYPAQASIQAATQHEHVAVVTGLYLATYNIGSAFGNAVSGAIWTQTLVSTLLKNLPPPYNTKTIAEGIYASPFAYVANYPVGTPMRDGIVASYRHTQKMLTITGLCLCLPLIIFSLCIRNPKLGDEQSLPVAEAQTLGAAPESQNGWELSKFWN